MSINFECFFICNSRAMGCGGSTSVGSSNEYWRDREEDLNTAQMSPTPASPEKHL